MNRAITVLISEQMVDNQMSFRDRLRESCITLRRGDAENHMKKAVPKAIHAECKARMWGRAREHRLISFARPFCSSLTRSLYDRGTGGGPVMAVTATAGSGMDMYGIRWTDNLYIDLEQYRVCRLDIVDSESGGGTRIMGAEEVLPTTKRCELFFCDWTELCVRLQDHTILYNTRVIYQNSGMVWYHTLYTIVLWYHPASTIPQVWYQSPYLVPGTIPVW